MKNPALTKDQRADLATRFQEMCSMTWGDLQRSGRHKQGFEFLPTKDLKVELPRKFQDSAKVMVFRYSGRRPMAGVRVDDTYFVLAIEAEWNDLYNHGST